MLNRKNPRNTGYFGYDTPDFVQLRRKINTLIDVRLDREDYRTVAFFSKDKLPLDSWPLVENAVKEGYAAYCLQFPFKELEKLQRGERYRLYGMVRTARMNNGYQQVYFEYVNGTMYVALIKKA
jgi:hypothetical protein